MTDRTPDTTASRGPASRTDVDIATGVLVGVGGGSVAAAVDDLFATARDNRVSLFELARAVITLAEGKDRGDSDTRRVALARWGSLLAARSASENSVSA
ncbi:ANTAR domain-containing protein [Rhodococcoides kyotonense]|uniref:ANTAR domain-containing protein n=1 Tax=Rhodococcoides kyotonense TaxID=398843 RepID=A0A239E907_9NOCA|nr:ANTAR domain-containing protein [Rhodococcus kyotonensis]SNS40364.1 ANTAR domain-containing protein [Rhodococcus kyotonensis]